MIWMICKTKSLSKKSTPTDLTTLSTWTSLTSLISLKNANQPINKWNPNKRSSCAKCWSRKEVNINDDENWFLKFLSLKWFSNLFFKHFLKSRNLNFWTDFNLKITLIRPVFSSSSLCLLQFQLQVSRTPYQPTLLPPLFPPHHS